MLRYLRNFSRRGATARASAAAETTAPATAASTATTPGSVQAVTPTSAAPRHNGRAVPTYPEAGAAPPAAPPALVVASQQREVDAIQQSSGLSHEDFTTLILPTIERYAAYVHLLPASETHHHAGLGGLFRHGLECARLALLKCESKVFALDHPPSVRKHLEPRWRVAAMLGAMLHDMGKPIIDVGAIDASGDKQWNPHTQSLYAWLEENGLTHYYIQWKPGARHKRHEAFTTSLFYRIVPDATLQWLGAHGGAEVIDAVMEALTGVSNPRNPLTEIVKAADSASVDRDLKATRERQAASGSGGSRGVASRIVRIIHDQIQSGEWVVNTIDGGIFMTDDGVFARYPDIARKAIELLRAEGETSIPNESSVILEILNDHGFIRPNHQGDGVYLTWNVAIDVPEKGRSTLLSTPAMLFSGLEVIPTTMVSPTALQFDQVDVRGNRMPKVGAAMAQAPAVTPVAAPTTPPDASAGQAGDATTDAAVVAEPPRDARGSIVAGGTPIPGAPGTPLPVHALGESATERRADGAPATTTRKPRQAKASTPSPIAETADPVAGAASPLPPVRDLHEEPADDDDLPDSAPAATAAEPEDDDGIQLRDRKNERDVRDEEMSAVRAKVNGDWPPATAALAQAWFEKSINMPAGAFLVGLAERVRSGMLAEGKDVFDRGEHLHIRFPQGLTSIGIPPRELHGILDKKGWVVRDPRSPGKGTVELTVDDQTINAVRLSEEVSDALRLLLPKTVATATGVRSDVFPMGPYIGTHVAGLIKSKKTVEPSDSPHLRLAFNEYVVKMLEARDGGDVDVHPKEWRGWLTTFAKEHGFVASVLQLHLTEQRNAYLRDSRTRPAGSGSAATIPLIRNPDYDIALDRQAAMENVAISSVAR